MVPSWNLSLDFEIHVLPYKYTLSFLNATIDTSKLKWQDFLDEVSHENEHV